MAVFKPRTRVVSFRLAEDEYESLKALSQSQGTQSISEFARLVTCQALTDDGPQAPGSRCDRLRILTGHVRRLEEELKRLAQLMRAGDDCSAQFRLGGGRG